MPKTTIDLILKVLLFWFPPALRDTTCYILKETC